MTIKPRYITLRDHYEQKFRQHGDNHHGVDWPNRPDAERRYDVMLGLIQPEASTVRLLDIGCGLAHLYDRIRATNLENRVRYEGLDISAEFVAACKAKHPHLTFYQADLLEMDPIPLPVHQYDYVILNGVFTEKLAMTHDEMSAFFHKLLSVAFEFASKGLAFNVMSKHVDWERSDLFHLPFDEAAAFLSKYITRNFVIRSDYGLYEYTVYLYR